MKKILPSIIFTFILFSCVRSDNDLKLLGNWNSMNYSDTNELQFYRDSIVFYEMGQKYFGKWKSKNKYIYIDVINPESDEIINEYEIEYKLKNDSLFIKRSYDSAFVFPTMIKVGNRFEHWQKIIGLKIDLKTTENELQSSGEDKFNQEVYIGFREGKLISKIGSRFVSLDGGDAKRAAFNLRASQSSEIEFDNLKFVLIIDKNISEFEMDSIKKILRQTPIKKIFRVFRNDTINYYNLNWRGNKKWYGIFE